MGAFGEKLRKQREQRGLALDAISNTTKISTRMLRALEDEHFDQLPGGVFNKGFVRAYARQVGLDEEEAIADYLAALRESQIQQQAILPDFRAPAAKLNPPPAPELRPESFPDRDRLTQDLPGADDNDHDNQHRADDRRKHERRRQHEDFSPVPDSTTHAPAENHAQPTGESSAQIPWGKLAAALLPVTLALAFWSFRRHREPTAAPQPALASNQSPTSVPAPFSTPASPTTQPSSPAGSLTGGQSSPAGTLSAGKLSAGTISASTTPPTATIASTTAPRTTLPPSPTASTTGTTTKPTATPPAAPVAKSASPATAAKPPATFTLLIRAEKTTWVSIVADGKPVAEETLIAPAHTSIRASHEIYVRAGNAAGISFLLNGKEFPAHGNEGEVKTYIFDATGIRTTPVTWEVR